MDAQPREAEALKVGRSYGDTGAPENLRTLEPIVGLQRRVTPLGLMPHDW